MPEYVFDTLHDRYPLAVHIFLVQQGKILLMRWAGSGYADGQLGLPAGHVDLGETPTACAVREAEEELGIRIEHADLVAGTTWFPDESRTSHRYLLHRSRLAWRTQKGDESVDFGFGGGEFGDHASVNRTSAPSWSGPTQTSCPLTLSGSSARRGTPSTTAGFFVSTASRRSRCRAATPLLHSHHRQSTLPSYAAWPLTKPPVPALQASPVTAFAA
ncbi:NUDIX domain-containing protein [Saccharomonospora xinjiangensis]|uniref:NUDIX domain-containing protein n=1 Tax=Saccharomonospora xinjiangensis TaxID=75294 RepID=UPI0010C3467C|nr:NUDIX domain-containing protein [Saccharomonospora xinjiangensis]QBQ62042.1 8-oxo-dGTP diphosphatase [Saccharomonospora xinjiangensis]